MYSMEVQSFGVVYIENNCLGVCIFDGRQLTINCGQILHFCYTDRWLLHEKLSLCTQILTNQAKNNVFAQIQPRIRQFRSQLKPQSIFQILRQLPTPNVTNITNKDHYYTLMLEQSPYKFKSLGILLYHLTHNTPILTHHRIYFQSIEYWNDYIFQHLQTTHSEITYLQITAEHIHPSLIKTNVQNTLGSSILKVYDSFLRTKGGKKCLKRVMLNPTYDKKQLQKRHYTIQWMIRYMEDRNCYAKMFRNIYPVDCIMERFQRDGIEEGDWRKLVKSMEMMVAVRNSMMGVNPPEVVREFVEKDYWPRIISTLNTLNQAISFTPSFTIRQTHHPHLAHLRTLHTHLPHILTELTRQHQYHTPYKLLFMPQIGYLLQLPHDSPIQPSLESQWQLKFTNFNGKFYSNQLTKKLDEEYGDVSASIKDIEMRILDELEQEVNEVGMEVVDAYWAVCGVEVWWGVAQLGRNMARPKLAAEELIVVDGWNVLLGQDAVENHSFSFHHQNGPSSQVFNSQLNIVNTSYTNRCSILSGPNGSGKTVYMKQLGCLIYLAHCGFFLPATYAEIPLTDRIAVIQSSSSLYSDRAGFERELTAMSKVMNRNVVTNKAVVLIDELGLSQDYTIALKTLYACVRYLSDNKQQQRFQKNKLLSSPKDHFNIPLTLIITHLTQLMANKLIEENYYVRYLTMDVNNDFDFLFKIKPGLVKSGYGIKSAEGYIRDEKFLETAEEFWRRIR